MMPNDLLKIGQVVRMYGISMGTLRSYEKEGMVSSEYIGAYTDYRYFEYVICPLEKDQKEFFAFYRKGENWFMHGKAVTHHGIRI